MHINIFLGCKRNWGMESAFKPKWGIRTMIPFLSTSGEVSNYETEKEKENGGPMALQRRCMRRT